MAAILDFQVAHRAELTSSPQRTFVPNLVLVSQFARLVPLFAPLLRQENTKRFYKHVRNFVKTDASVDHLITSDENQISDHFEITEEFNRFF